MNDIIKIVIKGSSGFCCIDNAYSEKLTLTADSLKYEYTPRVESPCNRKRFWSYKTSNPKFSHVFEDISALMPDIIDNDSDIQCFDAGALKFTVTYQDKKKKSIEYFCTCGAFPELTMQLSKIIPENEDKPLFI